MGRCPQCNREDIFKVIYYGLPGKLCNNNSCNCLFGVWMNITYVLPFNGMFMVYEDSYWPALWTWLTD